jgi:hypothetical protein
MNSEATRSPRPHPGDTARERATEGALPRKDSA